MDFLLDSDDYSDDEDLGVADLPEWYIEEELYLSKLNIVSQFKSYINKEVDFYGVHNISDVELLDFIENSDSKCKPVKTQLTDYQYGLFDDIHIALFGVKNSKMMYDKIASKIYQRCYI